MTTDTLSVFICGPYRLVFVSVFVGREDSKESETVVGSMRTMRDNARSWAVRISGGARGGKGMNAVGRLDFR